MSDEDRPQSSEEMLSEVTEWLAGSPEEPEPEVEPSLAAEADDSAVPRPSEFPPPDTEALNSALERVMGKLGADGWEARITQQGAEKAVIESKPRKKHGQWQRLLVDVSGGELQVRELRPREPVIVGASGLLEESTAAAQQLVKNKGFRFTLIEESDREVVFDASSPFGSKSFRRHRMTVDEDGNLSIVVVDGFLPFVLYVTDDQQVDVRQADEVVLRGRNPDSLEDQFLAIGRTTGTAEGSLVERLSLRAATEEVVRVAEALDVDLEVLAEWPDQVVFEVNLGMWRSFTIRLAEEGAQVERGADLIVSAHFLHKHRDLIDQLRAEGHDPADEWKNVALGNSGEGTEVWLRCQNCRRTFKRWPLPRSLQPLRPGRPCPGAG